MQWHIDTGRQLPEGQRIYAIGDVHGQIDLLNALLDAVDALEAELSPAQTTEIFLGDYIDRGVSSAAVIERLCQPPAPGRSRICLRGNHEAMMRAFLQDPAAYHDWRTIGGLDTLASYGLPRRILHDRQAITRAWKEFQLLVPQHHRLFLERLPSMHRAGDYLFVHAGIRPGRPLKEQTERDLLWIRSEFLNSEEDQGFAVVHGHTPSRRVEFRPNRIGVDTGAYATRKLSCVLLQDSKAIILQADPDTVRPIAADEYFKGE